MSNDRIISREANIAEKEILVDKYKTALKKQQFINELKSGLGDEIKKNPSKVKIIEKKWYQKIGTSFKNLFTKF